MKIFILKVSRHGDRTPIRQNEFYQDNEKIWSKFGGYGQLTMKGLEHSKQTGLFFKNYYSDFIKKKKVSDNKFIVRSTNYNRTILTAKWLINGLFSYMSLDKPIPVIDSRSNEVNFNFLY
jgi:hypothetical protein